jgi:hypothetical protein
MESFTQIVGWLILLTLAMALAGLAIVGVFAGYQKAMHWMYCKAYYQAQTEFARHIRGSSHWFSEDVGAWIALQTLAETLERDRSISHPEHWRQEWRERVHAYNQQHSAAK